MRKLTRTIVICINSFNSSFYCKNALKLAKSVFDDLNYGGLKFLIVCVFGGCDEFRLMEVPRHYFISIPQNLSDHNAFTGVHHFKHKFPDPSTFLFIHDTCTIKPSVFRKRVMTLSRLNIEGWIFAHALGLYNIGVCDLKFACKFAKSFEGIQKIEKCDSIKLEHDRNQGVNINGKILNGLRTFSNYTLNDVSSGNNDIDSCDYHSITSTNFANERKQRHVVFLGKIGVFKFTFSPGSFLLPIWVNEYAPTDSSQFDALTDNVHIRHHEWVRALIPHNTQKILSED